MKFATTVLASLLLPSMAVAQSAKFAASWQKDCKSLAVLSDITSNGSAGGVAYEPLAVIKVPSQKELLIGLSGIVNLVTLTEAKGKADGVKVTSTAEAGVVVTVKYGPSSMDADAICASGTEAEPGMITLSARRQTLSVTNSLMVATEEDLAIELEGSVDVSLELETTAAHSYQFITPDLESGEYKVVACFQGDASALVEGGDGLAGAKVVIGKRMLTLQEVRAVQGEFDLASRRRLGQKDVQVIQL